MGKVWNLEFAVNAACSLLVRHHGSHARLQCTEPLLAFGLAKSSHRFCAALHYGLTSVPSRSHAVVLCVLFPIPWFSCGGEFVFLVVV